ncbi:hypothetical protein, partial [Rhodopirellula bahusiensis]
PLDYRETRPTEGGASYSLRQRFQRLTWNVTWTLLASWTPAPLHRWRVFLLRLFGANVHPSAHVYRSAKIWLPQNLTMGPHACLGPKVNCYNMAMITLDDHAIVSQGTHLCAGTHDVDDEHFQLFAKPIAIGAHAWIAAEAFIGPGVALGERCVVGARAVLFKDTAPDGIYAGNPAKLIRQRRRS